MIIAFTGEKLAGKGTAAAYLQQQYQAQLGRFSQPLSDILERLHQLNSRANLVALGTSLRQIFGDDILAQVLKQDLLSAAATLQVIDGMRYMAEYDILHSLPDFRLIYITAPVETRYARTQHRAEKVDEAGMSLADFQSHEQDVTEQGITELAKLANHTIYNTGTLTALYQQLDQLV